MKSGPAASSTGGITALAPNKQVFNPSDRAFLPDESLVIAFDPGTAKGGLSVAGEKSLVANLYIIDFSKYLNGNKVKTEANAKKAFLHFIRDLVDMYPRPYKAILVETQKISKGIIKTIARVAMELFKFYFSTLPVIRLDPAITRGYWGIRVSAADHLGKDERELYRIRKKLSENSGVLSLIDLARAQKLFTMKEKKGRVFYVDAIDASLLVVAFLEETDRILAIHEKANRPKYPPLHKVKSMNMLAHMPSMKRVQLLKNTKRTKGAFTAEDPRAPSRRKGKKRDDSSDESSDTSDSDSSDEESGSQYTSSSCTSDDESSSSGSNTSGSGSESGSGSSSSGSGDDSSSSGDEEEEEETTKTTKRQKININEQEEEEAEESEADIKIIQDIRGPPSEEEEEEVVPMD